MKKVVDVMQELNSEPNTYYKEQILRKWANNIVEKCVEEAETEIYDCGPLGTTTQINKSSILKVKKLL